MYDFNLLFLLTVDIIMLFMGTIPKPGVFLMSTNQIFYSQVAAIISFAGMESDSFGLSISVKFF